MSAVTLSLDQKIAQAKFFLERPSESRDDEAKSSPRS
jgi:hypothetical protein